MLSNSLYKDMFEPNFYDGQWDLLTNEQRLVLRNLLSFRYKLIRVYFEKEKPYALIGNERGIEVITPDGHLSKYASV